MKKWTWFFMLLVLSACNSGTKKESQQKQEKQDATLSEKSENIVQDGTSLFDGKTLDGWEITNFGTQGPVLVSEGNIVLNFGDGCTGVTYTRSFPKVNYEISLDAMKVSGSDFFCGMTFPVKDTYCSFIVGGWGGPVLGLSTIDGNDASDNSTKLLMNFEKNTWYHIRLQVTEIKIMAWIDDKQVLDFTIDGHKLGIRPEVSLSRPFGICSWNTTAALRNIRLKKL
jgi:hypothetical protein